MLQNAYFIAKIGADTAENEQHFAEILPIVRRVASSAAAAASSSAETEPALPASKSGVSSKTGVPDLR